MGVARLGVRRLGLEGTQLLAALLEAGYFTSDKIDVKSC